MKTPSILFAIPCYGGNVLDKCVSGIYNIAKQFDKLGIRNDLLLIANESLISTGRSTIANNFINNTDYDFLMCIDADIGFRYGDVLKLLSANKPFVTAAYTMKVIPPKYNFKVNYPLRWEDDLVEVEYIGTGFQLIHRSVFHDIAKHYPELKYIPHDKSGTPTEEMKNNSYHFYQTMIDGGIVPEDFSFCLRYKKTGGTIWLDTSIELSHTGSHVFEGIPDLKESLKNSEKEMNDSINSDSNSVLRRRYER